MDKHYLDEHSNIEEEEAPIKLRNKVITFLSALIALILVIGMLYLFGGLRELLWTL